MDKELRDIIAELGVDIVDVPALDSDGKYIAAINKIVLDGRLSDQERTLRLLHELGHACMHKNNYVLYKKTFALHSKMENEAEEYMIEKVLEARFDDPEFEASSFNYMNFIESYEIEPKYESFVKEFMTRYLSDRSDGPIFF